MRKSFKFTIGVVIVLTLWIIGYGAYKVSRIESVSGVVDLTTAVLGLFVALCAFVIAMLTYSSIDSVNVITKMEGNVLENENYITSFTSLIKEYNQSSSIKISEAIFLDLENRFKKKSKTAVQFADNLQHFIDLIIFFPYLFQSDKEENTLKLEKLLNLIEKKRDMLLSISTGNLILIKETVKLIKAITLYKKTTETETTEQITSLMEVRGTMLKNPVTQTV
ncbi:hypothetical protein IHV09_08750 [Fictibacillus sp. 23RED33]|uniref:hypothetical protein n=1 Tax=Fictibacillus sp. 23RED33 TaxID=2745879 RepID=UPI0018CFBBD5|nr:hypothetical protein [Fictibacillus sp. 23RED33]MBH0173644.1 hypothetical protein [Fictibacillus sp. 23RED33]